MVELKLEMITLIGMLVQKLIRNKLEMTFYQSNLFLIISKELN